MAHRPQVVVVHLPLGYYYLDGLLNIFRHHHRLAPNERFIGSSGLDK